MSKQDVIKLGFATSNAFRVIGESVNLTAFIKPKVLRETLFIDDTQIALKEDWDSVGKEVELAIDRFEKEYSFDRQLRDASRIRIATK